MRGRTVVVALVVLLAGFVGFLVWIGMSSRAPAAATPRPGASAEPGPRSPESRSGSGAMPPEIAARLPEAGPVDDPIHDRAVRDELRRRILEAWAASPDPEVASAARDGRFVPIPEDRDASRAYLQDVVKNDFFPLAKDCYEDLLTKQKSAGGTMTMKFKIVGDEKIGGVIDDVTLETEGGLEDPEMMTCMRESFLSLSFRPPPGGWMTVTYPITFAPDGPDDASR